MKTLRLLSYFILGLALGMIGASAFAVNQNHECQGGHNCNGGNDADQQQDQRQGQAQGQAQGQQQSSESISESSSGATSESFSEGGDGGTGGEGGTGGSSVSDSTSHGGSATSTNSGVTVNNSSSTTVPRDAPSVIIGAGRSTAPMLKCIGLGGSGASGGAAGGGAVGWCWIVRPMWFDAQYIELASMGLKEQAARAKCMERIQWRAHGSQDNCEATIHQWLIGQEVAFTDGDGEPLPEDDQPGK